MRTPKLLKIIKGNFDRWCLYIKNFGLIEGVIWHYKLRVASHKLESRIRIGDIEFRNTIADISVFEKFYIYKQLDDLIAPLPANASMLDLGGNIGLASRRFLELKPGGTVCVVEPASSNLEILERNLKRFSDVEIVSGAVGRSQGIGKISDLSVRDDSFTVEPVEYVGEALDTFPIYALSDLLGRRDWSVLKCDIEGAEFDIFDPDKSPNFKSLQVAVVEIHPIEGRVKEGIINVFDEAGFHCFQKGEDSIFVRK